MPYVEGSMREQDLADPRGVQRQPRTGRAHHRHGCVAREPVDVQRLVPVAHREVDRRQSRAVEVVEIWRGQLAQPGVHRCQFGGALAKTRPDDLAAGVIRAALDRTGLDPGEVDEVVVGNANGAGEENRNVARMASLLAGLPVSVPGTSVNRLCGSSLDAAMIGSLTIETGDADIVLTGGVESMTRAPWVLPKPERAFPAGNTELVSTTLGWRLVNPRMPAEWTVSLGESNEQLQEIHDIPRERQDAFAARSHALALAAWESGFYDDLMVPVEGVDLARDETIRPGTTAESRRWLL